MHLDELLRIMTKQGASNLHLKPTRPPLMRINGRLVPLQAEPLTPGGLQDRKSTRLNSSHLVISYTVFCVKETNGEPGYPLVDIYLYGEDLKTVAEVNTS